MEKKEKFSTGSVREPITLSWENVRYGIDIKTGRFGRGGTTHKQILNDVTGIAKPGQTLAILGSTGAGKSTLLDILAGREKSGRLTGNILVNGVKLTRQKFNRISGYVTQEDCLMGTQTVRETLLFYANLKLPSSLYSPLEKRRKVEQVLLELGLKKVADSLIGTTFKRGISGGEKKRVSIGCELITNPSLLFCDEPTTGLDAYNAMNVMQNLTSLATHKGYTVICTIHQPRSTIFELFDQLMLLSQGQVVYFGPAKEAVSYFSKLGFPCRPFVNPADYFMDVVVENEKHAAVVARRKNACSINSTSYSPKEDEEDEDKEDEEDEEAPLFSSFSSSSSSHSLHILASSSSLSPSDLRENPTSLASSTSDRPEIREAWLASSGHRSLLSDVQEASKSQVGIQQTLNMETYATNVFWQVLYVAKRSFSNYIRNPMTTYVQLAQTLLMSLLVGSIYFGLDKQPVTNNQQVAAAFQNREGALFFIINNQAFASFASLTLFLQERNLFHREREAGTYRTVSYFFAKTLIEAPLSLLFPLLFGTISYWMIGLQPDLSKFGIFIAALITFVSVAGSVFVMIGALSPSIEIAQILGPITTVLFVLFGGFFVNTNSIPSYYVWIKYISYFRYGFQIVAFNEFSGLTFPNCLHCTSLLNGTSSSSSSSSSSDTGSTGGSGSAGVVVISGEQELELLGMENVDLAENFGILIAILLVCRSLTLLFLHFLHKNKN